MGKIAPVSSETFWNYDTHERAGDISSELEPCPGRPRPAAGQQIAGCANFLAVFAHPSVIEEVNCRMSQSEFLTPEPSQVANGLLHALVFEGDFRSVAVGRENAH